MTPPEEGVIDEATGLVKGTAVTWGPAGREMTGTAVDGGDGQITVVPDDGSPRSMKPASALEWEGKPKPPTLHNQTDAGNAKRLIERHGESLHYVVEWKEWVVWDGARWRRDSLGRVMELAKDTARAIYEEPDAEKWARQSESSGKLKAMVELAQTEDGLPIEAATLDSDVWLLNCDGGTFDLRTGKLRDTDRSDLITKSTGVGYDPNAKCPSWDKFVLWSMDGRKDLVEFIQRALGYSLTGDVSERLVFLLHGTGRNGKSTMLKTFRHLLGDYALRVASTTFERPRGGGGGGGASPHLAQLKGARFVTTSEVEDGMQLATTMLKDMTGDETVSARELYKAPVEFMPEFKPWIAANHKPQVDADDQAIWDRLRLVPFVNRVSERDMDRELGDTLKAEAPGILAWAVRGCLDWRRLGELPTPDAVLEATQAYRDEMDTFTDFLNSLEQFDPNAMPIDMSPTGLFEEYLAWAKKNGAPKLNTHTFKRHMEKFGFTQKNRGERGRVWEPPSSPKSPLASKKKGLLDYGAMAKAAAKKPKSA